MNDSLQLQKRICIRDRDGREVKDVKQRVLNLAELNLLSPGF